MGLAAFNRMRRRQAAKQEAKQKQTNDVDVSKLKVDELKALLNESGIEYPADAKKADLVALAVEHEPNA